MNDDQRLRFRAFCRWQEALRPGDLVEARWGYGQGFRARGRAEVVRLNRSSIRVRLTEAVQSPHGGTWPAGQEIGGLPRADSTGPHPEHGVFPVE